MASNLRGELRKRIDQVVEEWLHEETELAGRGARVLPGDLFLFPLQIEQQPQWAVIQGHPDDAAIWFVIPGDLNPHVGSADVTVPEESLGGPLTLRCGNGLWLTEDKLDLSLRCGVLEDRYVGQVQQKLAELARGTVWGTPAQEETDFDPEYEDWLDEVATAAQALAEWSVGQEQASQRKSPSDAEDSPLRRLLAAILGSHSGSPAKETALPRVFTGDDKLQRGIRRFHLEPLPSATLAAANHPLPISSLPQSESLTLEDGGTLHCTVFHNAEGKVVVTFRSSAQELKGRRILLTATDEQEGKQVLNVPVALAPDDDGLLSGTFDLSLLDLQHRHMIEFMVDMTSG